MAPVYRAIKEDDDGSPWVSHTVARGLGVRVPHDVEPDDEGVVHPGDGGPSVCPHPDGIPWFLRGQPTWELELNDLPDELAYRDDPGRDDHGFLEPAYPMDLEDFRELIEGTRDCTRIGTFHDPEHLRPGQGDARRCGGGRRDP